MEKKKRSLDREFKVLVTAMLIVIFTLVTVQGIDMVPSGDFNGRGYYRIYNFTNISAEKMLVNNSEVITFADEANLNVNSSDYWDNYDVANTSQFVNNNATLSINLTWLDIIMTTLSGAILQSEEPNHNVNSSVHWGNLNETNSTQFIDQGNELSINTTWLDVLIQSIGGALYILQSDEPNLNVNSSVHWNNLNETNSTQFLDQGSELSINQTWLDSLIQTIGNALYILQANEPNLNVNSSNYWDTLNTTNSSQFNNQGSELSINTTWLSSATVTDHGALTGLGDDDHTQYLLANGQRELTGNWEVGTFNISTNGSLKMQQDQKHCFNVACTVYDVFNGTVFIRQGLTAREEIH